MSPLLDSTTCAEEMQARCGSAFSDTRRDAVLSRVSQSIAKKISDSGVTLDDRILREIRSRVQALYNTPHHVASPTLHLSHQNTRATSASLCRAQSSSGVSQFQIDRLVRELIVFARNPPPPPLVMAASSGASDRPPRGGCAPLEEEQLLSAPSPSSAADESQRHVSSPLPATSNPLYSQIVMSRSVSSLRSAADAILSHMGSCQSPASKRHRRIIRDAEEYSKAIALAEAERRDRDEKKRIRAQSCDIFRKSLDEQVRENQRKREEAERSSLQERQMINSLVELYNNDEKSKVSEKRRHLERQKMDNELRRIQQETVRTEEKRRKEQEEAAELAEFAAAAHQEQILKTERRVCQTNLLTESLHKLEEEKAKENHARLAELREAKKFQLKLMRDLDAQERQRAAYQKRFLDKVERSEQRSQRQLQQLQNFSSFSKDEWLEKKYDRERRQLEEAAQARQKQEWLRKMTAVSVTRHTLADQMMQRQVEEQQEKMLQKQWAQELQTGLAIQQARDDYKKITAKVEAQEWTHLLDAQSKYRQFLDTKDIVTSIARDASPVTSPLRSSSRSISSLPIAV